MITSSLKMHCSHKIISMFHSVFFQVIYPFIEYPLLFTQSYLTTLHRIRALEVTCYDQYIGTDTICSVVPGYYCHLSPARHYSQSFLRTFEAWLEPRYT
ncbi:hypothetical protein BDQ12DRAFT_683036 [Crucibulum laeve]|uniref:Uncharacterized protein n=1 Tax=Crucibulum laeve TaxID=68775 RepID=A0A5C3M058_9AGAR|nr:hypothetical protein BDQ12DRAFT_683036 [Crucibulum laeve]